MRPVAPRSACASLPAPPGPGPGSGQCPAFSNHVGPGLAGAGPAPAQGGELPPETGWSQKMGRGHGRLGRNRPGPVAVTPAQLQGLGGPVGPAAGPGPRFPWPGPRARVFCVPEKPQRRRGLCMNGRVPGGQQGEAGSAERGGDPQTRPDSRSHCKPWPGGLTARGGAHRGQPISPGGQAVIAATPANRAKPRPVRAIGIVAGPPRLPDRPRTRSWVDQGTASAVPR